MKGITLLEGNHLTSTERRYITEIIEKGEFDKKFSVNGKKIIEVQKDNEYNEIYLAFIWDKYKRESTGKMEFTKKKRKIQYKKNSK